MPRRGNHFPQLQPPANLMLGRGKVFLPLAGPILEPPWHPHRPYHCKLSGTGFCSSSGLQNEAIRSADQHIPFWDLHIA